MKFRNKKTGEEYEAILHDPIDIYFYNPAGRDGLTKKSYYSLAELNAEWEDYKPKEPLIKDEKIRKAVRAWAEAVGTECVEITHSRSHFIRLMSYLADDDELCMSREIGQIFDEKLYTIAELCGEEEE